MLTIEKFYDAQKCLRKVLYPTQITPAIGFSSKLNVFIKPENLQNTGSFKIRGAYYKISKLSESEKNHGVVACSAGNHAQGVALAAKANNIKAKIFIPSIAPLAKIEATKSYGAEVVIVDGIYDDAYVAAREEVEKTNATFIHPFDDEDIIAGQGVIGLEIFEGFAKADAVIVPIGGGGLVAGVSMAIKSLNPNCKVYGVQAAGAASMFDSFYAKKILPTKDVKTFADGIAVKKPGELTHNLCCKFLDGIVTVTDDQIATAILKLLENHKMIAEGAGATALAAVLFDKIPLENKNVVCVVSGGNIDVSILSRVINRGLVTSGRISDLHVELFDRPGELSRLSGIISKLGANVVQVNHTRSNSENIYGCSIQISLETRNFEHFNEIKEALRKEGYHQS